ncbi:MAG: heterodisulfide reductase-related iron-sulfur binding cluster [Promethearchaeota archaeon]
MDSLKYSFFLGCVMPNRFVFIEASIRRVMEALGVTMLEMEGAGCCPAPGVFRSFHIETWLTLAARNLTIAEANGADVVTGCSGCYGTLLEANHQLKHDAALRAKINAHLAKVGREYKGTIEVKHLIEALYFDFGLEGIRDQCKYEVPLVVAPHLGCHIIKPAAIRPWSGETEDPTFFNELIEATGAVNLHYKDESMCCGAGGALRSWARDASIDFSKEKIRNMIEAAEPHGGLDAIITCCPFCHLQMDDASRSGGFNIPVVYYTQLLGVSMGLNPYELGLVNAGVEGVPPFVPFDPILDKLKEAGF